MTTEFPWLSEYLSKLESAGLRRTRREFRSLPDAWCESQGKRLRNFASNDYLNLTHHPRVIEAARQACREAGVGSGASALVTGRTEYHVALEEQLCQFEDQPAAILFPSGYAANFGVLKSLLQSRDDAVFCERLNHASLIDGCQAADAKLRVYPHLRLDRLERELAKATDARCRVIVTDSIFSMDGDTAPLPELCDLAEKFDAQIVIDEAHATGVFGEHGRGMAEEFGVEDRIAVRIGTLSKAVGTLGGFVSGSKELIDWLWNSARTQFFSTSLPPSICAAACESLTIIESEPERRQKLRSLSQSFHQMLKDRQIPVIPSAIGPIQPVLLRDESLSVSVADRLRERGFLVSAIRPPTVPGGTSRLRITLSTAHTLEDCERLADALADLLRNDLSAQDDLADGRN